MFRRAIGAATALLLAGSLLTPAGAADPNDAARACVRQAVTLAADGRAVAAALAECRDASDIHETDPWTCAWLASMAPGWPPFVWITPEGDVYIWTGWYYEFVWDCPPYAS